MTRTFATLPESLQVAQYYAKRNVTDVKVSIPFKSGLHVISYEYVELDGSQFQSPSNRVYM